SAPNLRDMRRFFDTFNIWRNCSGVGQTSGLPVHGFSDSVPIGSPEHRARGRQTGGLPHVRT
ncbi:MAG: hypothetical protein NT167_17745, partial [Verrucomicrobia bacterium]|nr:hypothetical protein [Verrucomicrobiota bacterium]